MSQRGEGARAASQHGHEHAPLAAVQPLHVTAELVDPHRHLEAEGRGHGMLAVGAAGQEHVLGLLGEAGEGDEERGELAQEDVVGPAHEEELPCLRHVLGGRPPVHVAARVALAGAIQLPHQRHQRMPGLGQSRPHRGEIEKSQMRLANDLAGCRLRNDTQLRLGLGEGRLHVEPRLEARGLGKERTHTRVVDPERGGLVLHGRYLAW